ncbi:MAG: putative DNA binding domain-containing protein [Candidatus Magnetomorum sp.]|nr:putative DNA binding domain-containing protein [Candidatus Magnetomorum sp.]
MKERQNLEYKQSWRDEYLKWICGFANADGGTLIIGVNDNGQVVGIRRANKLLEDIPNKVRDMLGILVDVNLQFTSEGEFLEIIVEPYPYPISYKGQYHYRSGSTKQELKGAALDRFLLRKQGKNWDSVPTPYVKAKDLDSSALNIFKKRALKSKRLSLDLLEEPEDQLLEKLHLFEGQYLKRAAVLLFHPEPEKYITGAFIKIGYFENNADILYHDEIHGHLFFQIDHTMDLLLTKYTKALISYEGLQRIETYPVPEAALREILLNAVVHKDYASSAPVQISVYHNKILFWNPGVLPEGWTVETLTQKHASQPFNPDIANVFFRSGMIEAWGRGVEKVFDSCRKSGLEKPDLRYEKTGLWVEFKPTTQEITQEIEKATQEIDQTTQETTQEIDQTTQEFDQTTQENEKTTQQMTQKRILSYIKEKPEVTRRELAEKVGISSNGVKYHLKKLKGKGIIRHVGATKKGHWEILK